MEWGDEARLWQGEEGLVGIGIESSDKKRIFINLCTHATPGTPASMIYITFNMVPVYMLSSLQKMQSNIVDAES